MDATWFRRDDNTAADCLGHIITQGLGYRIEGQRPIDKPLDKFQASHLPPSIGANGPICFAIDIHHGSIAHGSAPVSRFSDIVIFGQ